MLRHFLIAASLLTITGILFPVLSFISGCDKAILEDAAIITWDTSGLNPSLLTALSSSLLPQSSTNTLSVPSIPAVSLSTTQQSTSNNNNAAAAITFLNTTHLPSSIPRPIPDWYSLHYLTLCSGSFAFSTSPSNPSNPSSPPSLTKHKDPTTTFCTPRWLDQRANLTQILISAATKSLSSPRSFPRSLYNDTSLDILSLSLPTRINAALPFPYDISPVLPAVATLITGFALSCFSLPLTVFATYLSLSPKRKPSFRLLPHAAICFAALGAIFLTASAMLVTGMGNLFSGLTPGNTEVQASTSPSFVGFGWTAACGM